MRSENFENNWTLVGLQTKNDLIRGAPYPKLTTQVR